MLIERIAVMGLSKAHKWKRRFVEEGVEGLRDRSSRPARTRSCIDDTLGERIEQLRRSRMPLHRIAQTVGRNLSAVSRFVIRLGLSSLKALDPREPAVRYEREVPGEMPHIDTKRLGRIERPSHRVTGNRKDSVDGAGWETLFVAIDDHARIAFTAMHPDEKTPQAVNSSRTRPRTTPGWT